MTSEKQLQEMFQVNYFSQIYLTQIISRGMAKNKKGNIIFVSSTSAINADYGRFAYSSSKAAILSSAKTLSKELSGYNIRVNSVSPGLTDTDLMSSNTKENILKSELKDFPGHRWDSMKRTVCGGSLFNRETLYVGFSGIPGFPGFSEFHVFSGTSTPAKMWKMLGM